MKKLLLIISLFVAVIDCNAQAGSRDYTWTYFDTYTADTVFYCNRGRAGVAFVAWGNEGEYAEVVFIAAQSPTYALGDTFKVRVGVPVNPPNNGSQGYGNAWIGMGTLTQRVTSNGDTIQPQVDCYSWR